VESDNNILVIALVILVPAAILWAIFLMRSGSIRRPGGRLGIPQALRPGEPDERLEGPRLERIQAAGLIATLATAIFIPAYWLPETERQEAFAERFDEESLERGRLIYQAPPEIPDESDPQAFREAEHALALGMGCENCHGGIAEDPETGELIPESTAAGGLVPSGFVNPATGEKVEYSAPPLNNVFQRWDEEVIRFTIERGRPGTPMPTWGVEFGGPMTQQMIDDVIAFLGSLPGNQTGPEPLSDDCEKPTKQNQVECGEEIFTARCAVCHGTEGQGKEAAGTADDTDTEANELDPWFQGMALWQGDVLHLDKERHIETVVNGRRYAFMPAWSEAPPQGIPVPPFPLTDAQIEAVVAYERSGLTEGGQPAPSPNPTATTDVPEVEG
jgi:mono/diheme cytochrome c family protein